MKKKYLYNGEYYTESEMNDFAKQSGVSFDNYIAALGKDVKVLDAPFEFKGNFYTQDEISAAAKKKGISDDTYLSQYGIKKKEDANIGGGISSAASKIGGQVGNFVGQSEKDNALSLIQSINAGITKGIEKGKQQFPNEIRATPEEEAALRDAQRRTGQADGLFTQQGAEQFNLLATDPLRAILDPEREKLQTAYNNRRLQGVRQTSDNTIARNNIDPNKTVQKKDGKLIPDVSSNPEYQVKNQEQALENVSGLVKNKFFKNGKEALEYAENQVKSGIDPTGNETIEHAITKAGEYKQKEESALNGKSIIQNAIEIQLQNDPLFKKQYETIINGTASDAEIADVARRFNIPLDKLKTQGSLPQEVVGELVHRFISDPDIKQIAEDNPEFKKDFDNFTGDKIYEVFPEYADVYIKNTLSRARELDGKNNWFANPIFDKSKYMDNLAEEVFKDRPILLKRVKDKFHNNWEHKIETTGIVDDLATGARGAMSGMWRSLKDVSGFGESYSDRIRNTLKEQYGHVETPHQNEFRKVVGEASNFMGMVLAMGATGSGLGNIGKGLGVMNPSVASKAVTLATFFDDELNHAASIYPENPTKAYLRASLSTAFFLVAGDAIPASKITGFKQNITQTLKSLETKALDKQAKMKLRDKILSVATETLQGTAKGTAEMTVMINGFKLLIDRALGLDESSINNEYSDANLLATAKSMLFGLPVPSMIHGFKGINRTRAAIYEMASNPEKYKSAILKRFGSDDHRIADIDFIADFKKYLDSMRVAENEKAKMVFNALHAKRLREQKSPDAFMKRNHEEEIRAIEQEQQDIMDGKDSDAGLTDSQKAIKTAYENGEINEMMEAQIKEALKDPAKADQFIKEIAEQATGAVAPELGNAKDGAIKFFGETLTDFAIGKSGKKGGGESVVFEYENEGEVPQKLKPLMVKDENGRITITMPKDEADALQKRIAEGLEPDMELMDGTLIKKADIKIKDVQDGRVKYKGEDWSKDVESTAKALEIKNEGKADAPTKENVQERLNINNPFYKKVEDALVKLGLIEKYNPETRTGDVVGGYAQKTSDGGISAGKMLFNKDGSISYFDGDVEVSFDKNGNVISENTKEASEKNKKIEIEGKKESIANLEKTRDSENFKYKEVTETDRLGNRKKVRRLKTAQELKESTDKINSAIDKAKSELATLEGKKAEPTFEQKVEATAKALEGVRFNANFNLPLEQSKNARQVAEAYHKAKADGSNPELVKAVESLLSKEQQPSVNKGSQQRGNPALSSVESTAKALEGIDTKGKVPLSLEYAETDKKAIAEAYHADRAAGKETELTKAVEELLGKPTEKPKTETTPTVSSEVVSGSALKDADANVNKIADEYLYHGTGEGAFRRIREEGLVPQGDKHLYFADVEQYARTYAQRKGNSFGDRILRVKKSDAYSPDENTTGGDFKIKDKINPNDIEIKHNGKWVKIQEYSDENIGIMPIPKAPTQYTEAATPKKESGGVSGSALKDVDRISNKEIKTNEGEINTGVLEEAKDIPNVNKVIAKDKNGNDIKVVINGDKLKGTILSRNGTYLFKAMQGRVFTLAKVGNFYLPFYISSAGTSGKIQGQWYPFFGYNNWLVKGHVGKSGEMEYSKNITEVQNLLNENFIIPAQYLQADNVVAVGEQFVPERDANGKIIREGKYNFEKMIPNKDRKVLYDLTKDIDIITHHHQEQKGETKLNEHDWVAEKTGLNPKKVINDGKGSADNWIKKLVELTETKSKAPTQYTEAATPAKKESGGVSGSALKDVESTAKALGEISKTEIDKNRSIKNAEKIDDGTGSHIKNMSLSELNELARDMVKNEKEYQDKLSDAQGVYNLVVEKIDEISEAYHKAKKDGSNPELVKAVEELIGKKENQGSIPERSVATNSNQGIKADTPASTVSGEGNVEAEKQQLKDFGVNEKDVDATHSLITQVFSGLKKAGLTAAKTVGDWVGIGKGSEKPYSLKIDGKDTQVKNVQPEVVNGFYSPLEKIITESKFDKLPAKQWAEKYANSEEAKWTGLKDWLAKQQGSVSKADIQQYLKDNRIQVVEVVKLSGEPKKFATQEEIDIRRTELEEIRSKSNSVGVRYGYDSPEYNELTRRDKELYEWLQQNAPGWGMAGVPGGDMPTGDVKYSDKQLEGQKENYKEVLVTMPEKEGRTTEIMYDDWGQPTTNPAFKPNTEIKKGVFHSTHFDEPNILVHLRMNTRTDAEGKKVLFLEEIQSDWGQKGKKEGFKTNEREIELKRLQDEAGKWGKKAEQLEDELDYQYRIKKQDQERRSDLRNRDSEFNRLATEYQEAEQRAFEARKAFDVFQVENRGEVSEAPFVTETPSWTKLGLKVALKEAVKQNAQILAWTTGEQQNSRYDLSKQVDYIQHEDGFGETKYVDISTPNGLITFQVDKQGKILENKNQQVPESIGKNLADVIGKDITERILNSTKSGRIEGEGLKVGGKGMKGFYGSPTEGKLGIVGEVAKSLFKQEPKTVDIFQSDKLASGWSVTVKDKQGYVSTQMFDSKSKGLAWLSEQEGLEVLSSDAEGKNYSTQHSIDITPELKASVEGGQPLFKDAEAQYRIESGKNIIEAIRDFDGSPRATVALTHEIMHPTVVEIFNGAKEGNETGARHANTIVEEYNKANPDKKITLEQMIEGNDAFINGRTTPEYRAVQEFIAEAWEKYHHEGAKGFSKAFQEVLDAITEVFRQVYKSLTGTTLTPELRKMFDELLGKENVSEVVKAPEISSKAKNKFSNLREKIKQKQSLKIVSDEAENRHANSKLTEADNPVQEPNVKALESEGENAKNAAQAENVIIKIDSIISAATDVGLRKVSDISTDEKRFQGRDKLNAEKVQEIAENWKDADQDPIHVWTDPKDGKTYVLSGHHRLAAAKQAGREKVKVIDRSKDFTEEQAIRFAKEEANANRTMETAIERANTLRQKRERGDTKDDINKFLDREGKNKNFVNNLSRLNPKGKTIEALRATEKSDDKVTQKEVEKIADWIGEARDRNKNLTDAHENELFDFLMDREGSKRITTKQDFLSKVNSLAGAMDFNANEPLNIARYKHKTEGEKLYDKEAETQKGKISDLQQRINEINDRIKNPNNPQYLNPDSKDYEEIKKNADNKLSELNTELQAESKALLDLYQQKGKFARQGTEQSSLFSTEKNETELPEDYYNDLRDIIKDLKDEHKGITLDEIKEIAKNELGEYYSEPDIEAAYKMTEPQPPKSAPEPPKSAPSRPDKSVLTNIVNAENTPPEVKKKLTAHGLKYDPESHDEALQIARAVIDSLGIDAAVTEARARNFGGAVNTFIQTEALNALYKKEAQAKTAQEKYEAAEKFAEVSIALDEWARGDAGRGISALATFYQKSPLGMVLKENKSRKEEFNQWAKGKEESWDEFLERLNKTPEFSDYVSEKVQTELREERKKERSKFFKKVDDTLDKWINDLESGNVAFSSVVPPKLIAEALKGVKAAFKVGESATKIIGDAIDYISDKIGDNWDKDTFRAKIEKALNLRAEKTSVDRYADSLKKQIEELQKQIDAGSRNKNQSNKRQLTPEEQSLLDEKKRLQKELNDIDPKTTFAQRIQKQIDDIQRQIDAGKRDEKERKNKKEYSEEEKELQEKLKAKKAELEALSPLKNTESYKLAELDKFREKLKGLSEAEKDEVVSKAYKKLLDNGALDHADLREIIAKATGRGNLTEKQAARLQELNETINAAEIAKQKHLKERTEQTLKEYHKAIDMAAKAKRDLANEFDKKTDYLKVISSSIQGNTLGLLNVAVMNPLYNITTHLALRLPIGTVQSLFGLALGKAEMNTVFGKPMQAEFFGKGGRGFREAFKGLLTGMNKADYESKEIFSSQIRPNRSLRALLGKDNREAKMKLQEKLFHTFSVFPGATAETNFRLLNFGDKPMRYSASAATAAAFAKKYGIKFNTMDWKTFMEFPREIVKEMELAKGKSLKEAEQEAEYVVRSIEKEGERSTMQQDNFFSDMLEKVFSGGKHEGAKSLAKTLTISPFVKIPSNVLWLGYNLVHPQIALAQAAAHTIRSYGYRGKGEIAESKLQMREARYWMSVTMMGAALQAVMIPLIKAGIITAANDEDDSKKKRIADLTYQPQGMFNMTKFWAYLSGKNVNEVQGGFEIPLKYFGLPGALGNSLARDYKQLTPEQKENRRLLTDNLLELFDADDFKDIENGIFSSSSSLLQGLKGGDMTYYAGNMVNLFTNLIQPAAVSEFSRAAIPYRISGKFDSLGDKIKNDLSNRSALFRKLTGKYPKGKRNIWGEIIKKDDSYANRYFGFNNVTKDNFAQFIYEDAQKWDDEDFLPPTVSNSLGGKKLTAEQLDELEENIGLARKEFIRAYTNDIALIEELGKNYSDILGRDAKKAALQYLYQKGRKLGVDMFVSKHPEFENVVSEEEKQVEELLKNFKEINLISEDEINEKIKH